MTRIPTMPPLVVSGASIMDAKRDNDKTMYLHDAFTALWEKLDHIEKNIANIHEEIRIPNVKRD